MISAPPRGSGTEQICNVDHYNKTQGCNLKEPTMYVPQVTKFLPLCNLYNLGRALHWYSQGSWVQIPYRPEFFQALFSLLLK